MKFSVGIIILPHQLQAGILGALILHYAPYMSGDKSITLYIRSPTLS